MTAHDTSHHTVIKVSEKTAGQVSSFKEELLALFSDCSRKREPLPVGAMTAREKQLLDEVLMGLTDQEEKIVRLRYGIGDSSYRSRKHIAQIFNITPTQVKQIEEKSLWKLRQKLSEEKPKTLNVAPNLASGDLPRINSKTCTRCKEKNNPDFNTCWKCGGPFSIQESDVRESDSNMGKKAKESIEQLEEMADRMLASIPTSSYGKKVLTAPKVGALIYGLAYINSGKVAENALQIFGLEADTEELVKMHFSLQLAFIASFAASAYRSEAIEQTLGRELLDKIMDGICDSFFEGLTQEEAFQKKHNLNFLLKDEDERTFYVEEVKKRSGAETNSATVTDYYTIASVLFQKRFLEYQALAFADHPAMLTEQPGFIPEMPRKVLQHWRGEFSKTYESALFCIAVQTELTNFDALMSIIVSKLEITP